MARIFFEDRGSLLSSLWSGFRTRSRPTHALLADKAFNHWSELTKKFSAHQKTVYHKDAERAGQKFVRDSSCTPLDISLPLADTSEDELQSVSKARLLFFVKVIILIRRQGLSFFGRTAIS